MEGVKIKNITVEYENGDTEKMSKGLAVDLSVTEDGERDMTIHFVNITSIEIEEVFYSLAVLGIRMGLFDDKED